MSAPRRVEVWTLRDGKVSHDAITWAEEIKAQRFPIISNEWKHASLANTPTAQYDVPNLPLAGS